MLIVGIQLSQQALVDSHAQFAAGQSIARIDAGDHRKRVVVLGHRSRRHGEQHSRRVHKSDLLALAHKCYRLPLDHRYANAVWKKPHYRGMLDPRNRFQLLAPLAQRNEENIAANIFTKDWEVFGTLYVSQSL